MTSEGHHVPSISTLPRTQFLSYDQLAYMTYRRISRAIKTAISDFLHFENLKIQNSDRDQLYRHVSPALCSEHHGFIPRRSCMTNLAVYLQSAWETISDGYQTDAIYTDYSAAFQSVNHSLLIHKLKHSYKLEEFALKWFVSYSVR